MKQILPLTAIAALLSITPGFAEPPRIEHVIDLLKKAKESDKPVPILEQARKVMKDYNPTNGLKATAAGIGARRQAANTLAGQEHKHKTMEAIRDAIEASKTGGDPKSKIDHAIAMAHQAGNLK